MFWELFSWNISFQLHEIMFSELISQYFLARVYPDYVIIVYITELVSNCFPNYVIVAKHTMWTSDYIK